MSSRSEIKHFAPLQAGHGSSRTWTRTIAGKDYSFVAITMPDGERRYAAYRLTGPDPRFDCYWTRVMFWTVPAPAQLSCCGKLVPYLLVGMAWTCPTCGLTYANR